MEVYALDTPCIVVDRPRLERNIAAMAQLARSSGKVLRPHAKTHKCVEIARMQLAAGAVGLTTAKISEADCFADDGPLDIFIANEVIGSAKVARLARLRDRSRATVGLDSAEGLSFLTGIGTATDPLRVLIEVDTGLGRAGVRGAEAAVDLALQVARTRGIQLSGVFTHEGHVYRSPADQRDAVCRLAAARLLEAAEAIRAAGMPVEVVSVGSTPGAAPMAAVPGITELRPGTYVFGDAMQARLGTDPACCALSVLATVVSRPEPGSAILDCGTKALSGDAATTGSRYGVPADWPGAVLDWANEEHCHVDLSNCGWSPRVGDKVMVIPNHVCPCVNLHDELIVASAGVVEDRWRVAARGRLL